MHSCESDIEEYQPFFNQNIENILQLYNNTYMGIELGYGEWLKIRLAILRKDQ